jgi:RNA polymerase sigma-70 factor (ECF subfamily)
VRSLLKEKFLLFRIRAKKDPEAFGMVYDAYVKQIYRFIYFKVSSAEQAEDLTSETFLKAWQYLKEKREVPHLQALLYSIARSVVIDHYRRTACERSDVPADDERTSELAEAGSEKLLRDVETKFDMTRVIEKLRGLKDEYRDVVIMKYLDEMTTGEIADALGKSASNVRVLLHRATKALSDVIEHDRERTSENSAKRKK